jgi:hypothetical protein
LLLVGCTARQQQGEWLSAGGVVVVEGFGKQPGKTI